MKLNRRVAFFIVMLVFSLSILFGLYNLFIIQKDFIEKLKSDIIELNALILKRDYLNEELKTIKQEIEDEKVKKDLENYYNNGNTIEGVFEKTVVENILKIILNSRSLKIDSLRMNVRTKFPFVFEKPDKVLVSFFVKVGDLNE
ncbi:hypothetical protein [Thermosipho atlanticus]|uniref:Uncharacterized protein n=1 Tax=Thermosipho atlanticus DSM 15807 TaxID=1123380 RepID=A0A1M5SSC0_9BACT|nr:hypothetical protein [Thermosipho atlanticus]SHH41198.1 hypothetical protein SAMN02745199_1041 [Thermosipho atlanticus DSM 15807]